MTPLLGTKTPSAPVGNKSGGDRRAARSLLSCALWRGMGRLWRGMGGMGRTPSRYPHTVRTGNRAFRVFTKHETRDKALAWREARGALWAGANSEVFTRHETRDTRHGFFSNHGLFAVSAGPQASRGGCTKRCVNEWKEVYLNPETRITTFSESRLGSRPGISHYFPQCVGKIRISPCRQSSASAHAARSLLSCALWCGTGRLWRGMGGILPLSSVPAQVRCSRGSPWQKPRVAPRAARIAPRSTLRPADKERPWSILDIFDRGATQFRRDASPLNLHVSPRGEAKCVRGPSGLGASRAEEKGASRLARAGVLDGTSSTASKRNEVLAVVSRASADRW